MEVAHEGTVAARGASLHRGRDELSRRGPLSENARRARALHCRRDRRVVFGVLALALSLDENRCAYNPGRAPKSAVFQKGSGMSDGDTMFT